MANSLRQRAIQVAREYWAVRPVFIDTETTGLHPTAEIVEISIVDHKGGVLVDSLVRPRGTIPLNATMVHGITNDMVQSAPTWPEIWPSVEAALSGRYIGVYNADYDVGLMRQAHRANGMLWQPQGFHFFCIMKLYAQFRNSNRWQTLEAARRQSGISLPNSHRAKDDALLARAVLQHMTRGGF